MQDLPSCGGTVGSTPNLVSAVDATRAGGLRLGVQSNQCRNTLQVECRAALIEAIALMEAHETGEQHPHRALGVASVQRQTDARAGKHVWQAPRC